MKLRPYQQDAYDNCRTAFKNGHKRLLVVLPTGGGKTILFAKLAERFWRHRNERTLILSHREELVVQAVEKVNSATGLHAQIEKGSERADRDAPIVSASIQTMQGKRLESWDPNHFGLIVADEAHHAAAKTWQSAINHFNARLVGVTATPTREDHLSLQDCFDHLAYQCPIAELIQNNFLTDILIKSLPISINFSKCAIQAGDIKASDISEALEPYMQEILDHIEAVSKERKKIIIFLPLVGTSKAVCDMLNGRGIKALHIDGASKKRRHILEEFGNGDAQVLCNAMLLTEGYDEPCIDCVVVLRPTKSRGLYAQMVGRGTRLHAGKKNLLLLDFLFEHEKHNLARPWSLVSNTAFEEETISGYQKENHDEIDLLELQENVRIMREDGLAAQLANGGKKFPLSESLLTMAKMIGCEEMQQFQPACQWDIERPNKQQLEELKKKGAKAPKTQGEAKLMLDKLMERQEQGLATYKQLRQLNRVNTPEAEKMTIKEASSILGRFFSRR